MANEAKWISARLNERQEALIERLRRDRNLNVTAIAEELAVSTETIRRDVRLLASKGLLVKRHGNILWPDDRNDAPLQKRMAANMGSKRKIAQAVARSIKDGETLLIDSGSTTIYVAEALRGHRHLTVITNSAQIAQLLSMGEENRIFLAGGEIRADDCATFGPSCIDYIRQFSAETAIISAAALHPELGVMDHHMSEIEVCRAIAKQGERVIVAADQSKFHAKGLIAACPLSEVDLLVTDAKPPQDLIEALDAADVEYEIA